MVIGARLALLIGSIAVFTIGAITGGVPGIWLIISGGFLLIVWVAVFFRTRSLLVNSTKPSAKVDDGDD